MASVLIAIIFVVWNISCLCWHLYIVPLVIQKMNTGIRELSDSEAYPIVTRFFAVGLSFWEHAARPFMAICMVIVDLFLIISFLQSFH